MARLLAAGRRAVTDSHARFVIGDSGDVVRSLPDASVDLVLTSPPFLALRSYLPADHVDKAREIGSEATPAAFLDALLDLVVEWRRVLAPHGSICVELGDTYSGSGGAGGDYAANGLRAGQEKFDGSARRGSARVGGKDGTAQKNGVGWPPLAKSLCGIPHLFSLSLAYGRNLLTGREIEPWRVRNVVAWCRPNPPVGALGDKFRPATSYMTIATVASDRYFDLDAVRNPARESTPAVGSPKDRAAKELGNGANAAMADRTFHANGGGPPLDYWVIPTQPYRGAHYAVYPDELLDRPIKSMVPLRVCTTCGKPSRRIVERDVDVVEANIERRALEMTRATNTSRADLGAGSFTPVQPRTVGWTDCGHGTWRRGVVLDPFAGSGTTLAVAVGHGRDAIGVDLDERNARLAAQRVGLFLTVERFAAVTS